MTTSDNASTEKQTAMSRNLTIDEEVDLLDIFIVLAKHKKKILKLTLAAAILSVIISLLLTKIYTATSKILPPQMNQSSASSMLNDLMGGGVGAGGGIGSALGLKDPNAIYVAMLESRTIMERVAKRFDLQKTYDAKNVTDTLKILGKNASISSGKDGIIEVDVDDKNPKLAADLANAFIEELDKLMQTFSLTDASHRRLFFEQQLKMAKNKLTDAELVLDKTPNTSLQYMDALRNLKYRESIFNILAKQFEMAKLDEAKDYPLIQVLDKAEVPERKSRPKRALIVILSTFVALIFSILWAFFREAIDKAKSNPGQLKKLEEINKLVFKSKTM